MDLDHMGILVFYIRSDSRIDEFDFDRLESGFDVVELVERYYFEDGEYPTEFNEDYFFDVAWPLSTYFVVPLSEQMFLESSYIKSCYRLVDDNLQSFVGDVDEFRKWGARKILVWDCDSNNVENSEVLRAVAQVVESSGGSALEELIRVLELCRHAAESRGGYLAIRIHQSNKENYVSKIIEQDEDSEWPSHGTKGNCIYDLQDHGYVFTKYFI
jgi:hypothetical protein